MIEPRHVELTTATAAVYRLDTVCELFLLEAFDVCCKLHRLMTSLMEYFVCSTLREERFIDRNVA